MSEPAHESFLEGALCRAPGANASWWDRDLDGHPETDAVKRARHELARTVCENCPERPDCLTAAIHAHDRGVLTEGVYAGVLFPDEIRGARMCAA